MLVYEPLSEMEAGGSKSHVRAWGCSPERLNVILESHPAALRSAASMRKRWSTAAGTHVQLRDGPATIENALGGYGAGLLSPLGRRRGWIFGGGSSITSLATTALKRASSGA